jgi:predicted nucleotidyltransferase
MIQDPLREQLRLLALELQKDEIKLILGGGYGLVLKTEYIRQTNAATRFEEIPQARSTNDLDLFLSAEIITSAEKIEKIRDALEKLKFEPVAPFFQFQLPNIVEGLEKPVKIDLLAALPLTEAARKLVKISKPRIRPKKAKNIHGYLTEEALTIEDNLLPINIADADDKPLEIYLPHPFSYLVMKLFALRDRLEDEEKDFGAYHAFDIYRIIAMMTEKEWAEAVKMRESYCKAPKIIEAEKITDDLFANVESIGVLRVRQHARSVAFIIPPENLAALIEDLQGLLA